MLRARLIGWAGALALVVVAGAACREARAPSPGASGAAAPAFALACGGSATETSGSVYCVRTDTRTGDVLRVDITKLPVSNGPTAASAGAAGRFDTACAAVNMAARSDFSCVRLNTETGELMLINLTKVGATP